MSARSIFVTHKHNGRSITRHTSGKPTNTLPSVETKAVIEEREEIMSGIAEFTTVVVLVAIVLAPRLVDLYLSAKEESTPA